MPSEKSDNSLASSELILRTTPPRAPRHLVARPRLSLDDPQFQERAVIVVQGPAGFGKTSLLAQWRREFLAQGAAVAWLSAEAHDDPQRFLHSLVLAIRVGCGRPGFGRFLVDGTAAAVGEWEGITAWLAEAAQTALDLVLILDEADQLSDANLAALGYLLHNTPSNLRVVVAGRSRLEAVVADLVAYGECVLVDAESLRFRFDETLSLIRGRFGNKVDADTCARLHEVIDGWPLGLQLALSTMEGSSNPKELINAIATHSGQRVDQLIGGLIARLPAADIDFLVRISVVDLLHPGLCQALTGDADAAERLARLSRETPIFAVGDNSDWCRLHNLARDGLRNQLKALPAGEQADLHARAMAWQVAHGMPEDAARHALAAGLHDQAFDLAEQCLFDAVRQGQQGVVLDWLDVVPREELDRRPRLRLAAAWAMAVSERHEEARQLVEQILETAGDDPELRYECSLIASGAAYFADDPDRWVKLDPAWANPPPVRDPRLLQMRANRLSVLAILQGDPAQARRHQQQVAQGDFGKAHAYAVAWGKFTIGLSYLWEGQVILCTDSLREPLAKAEADYGRRHPLPCTLAALLATALYERDQLDEASALLANRLDVLERVGSPESVTAAYRTAARLAAAQGAEHRAFDLLEALSAVGLARQLPRLGLVALLEQIRMHAGRARTETCRALTAKVDEMVGQHSAALGAVFQPDIALTQHLCHAYAAIACQDWPTALAALASALPPAESMKLGRIRIEIIALKAFALDRNGEDGKPLLREAMNLAQTYGLRRTFVDAHPALGDWARSVAEADAGGQPAPAEAPLARMLRTPTAATAAAATPRAVPSMVLTPKEREVLELLARNLSNKEIAQAMSVGEETVKWHLKNLFSKLDAGTRKHVVRRAQLLGLLEGGE